jgi:hypothetical protein
VTQGKKRQQTLLVYEPWAKVIRWLFARFRELENVYALGHEIESMPYLFPDPTAEDLMRYTFKIRMTKVPGGFKPASMDAVKYILSNPAYIGAWVYDDAIVREDNHPAIVDRDLFLWAYHKITGRNLQGEPLPETERRRFRGDSAQAVLKYILQDPEGPLYVLHSKHPDYVRTTRLRDNHDLLTRFMYAVRASFIDDVFLERVKALAVADRHLGEHIKASVEELETHHTETIISVDEHLAAVRREIEKTMAMLFDDILTLTPQDKAKYNGLLQGLREREAELIKVQEESLHVELKDDMQELQDVLADIPAHLDSCSMERKQKLARLLVESATLEELSVHWLKLTVVWRGPIANRPDVCLIWRQHGRRNNTWTAEEDAVITEHYPKTDKWTILEALHNRSWNMIYQRALALGLSRSAYIQDPIPTGISRSRLSLTRANSTSVRTASQQHMRYGSTPLEQTSWRWNLVALHQNSPKRSWAGSTGWKCAPRAIRSRAWRGRCDLTSGSLPYQSRVGGVRLQLRCGQAVHAEREKQLATVMQVVLDQVPEDPLACQRAVDGMLDDALQVGRRPVVQAVRDHRPGRIKPAHQLRRAALRLAVVIPGQVCQQCGGAFAQPAV